MHARCLGHAEELDAVARAVQQLQYLAHLGDLLGRKGNGIVVEQDDEIAFGRAGLGHVERYPVVRQARPAQHEVARLERFYPVTHEGTARGVGDEMQLVLVMEMPAHQRTRETMCQAAHQATALHVFIAEGGRADKVAPSSG